MAAAHGPLVLLLLLSVYGAQLCIVNEAKKGVLDVYWKAADGRERLVQKRLAYLRQYWIQATIGHHFVVKDADTGDIYADHIVEHDGLFTIRDKTSTSSQCRFFSEDASEYEPCLSDSLSDVLDDAKNQRRRDMYTKSRLRNIDRVPDRVPHFHAVGFEKRKAPASVLRVAREYYKNNRHQAVREKWPLSETVVNFWEVPTYMIYLPEEGPMKPFIFDSIRPILESWVPRAGELDPTSCYGIRMYLNGSTLENHVDRTKTHAVSAIINLEQDLGDGAAWPLEIYDHSGKQHHLLMEPGDMVLYESASCVHGRPIPFEGRYFANFFVHYAPKDPALWDV